MLPEHPGSDIVDLSLICRIGCVYETSRASSSRLSRRPRHETQVVEHVWNVDS